MFIFKYKEDQLSLLPTGTSGCCQNLPNILRDERVIRPITICSKVLVAQACVTQGGPMDSSSPGFSVHGICQARILEWAFLSPGDLPNPEIELTSLSSPALQAESLLSESPGKPICNKQNPQN